MLETEQQRDLELFEVRMLNILNDKTLTLNRRLEEFKYRKNIYLQACQEEKEIDEMMSYVFQILNECISDIRKQKIKKLLQ